MALMGRLLDEALPLDEAGRRAWLATLPNEYQELAGALRQALLGDDYPATDVARLHTLPKIIFEKDESGGPNSALRPGERVGPYELSRLLGAGGMAEVWLAKRADGAFKREVALKLPMLTRMRKDLQQRFSMERDILASLEHPNIARLYDAGVDLQGLPYLAMEYVQGQPLNVWCDARQLGIRERIALFLQVLDALRYAHQMRVVHRDIKPSNILVTQSGQARLLDFGVAKLLEEAQANDQAELTSVYGRALTPEYSSPELLNGDPVDARSDIYSLGVLFYELLTGKRPYRFSSYASIGTLQQAIATVEVKKPSSQVERQFCAARDASQEHLVRLLRGDLDAIALKMLAEQPDARYASVSELADDLDRHLRGQPIKARPAGMIYRLRKSVQRNRTVVAVTATAATLALAMMAYVLQREAATRHRLEAASAAAAAAVPALAAAAGSAGDKSVAVLPFLDMSQNKDEEYFSDGLTLELIDRLARIPGLQVIGQTSSFSFKGKTLSPARIAKTLGVAHLIQGSVRRSGRTVRVTAQLIRADSGVQLWSQTYDGDVKDIFQVQDQIATAVVNALELKLLAAKPVVDPYRSDNADAYNFFLLAKQLVARRNLPDYKRAVEIFRRAIVLDPNYAAAYANMSYYETKIANVTLDEEGFKRARADAEKALSLSPQLIDGYRARIELQRETLDFEGCRADIEKVLAIAPGDSMAQSLNGVGLALFGRIPEAAAAMNRAIELDPLNSYAWANLGLILTAGHDYPAARRALDRAIAINQDDYSFHMALGQLDLLEGRLAESLDQFQKKGSDVGGLMGQSMVAYSRGRETVSQAALRELIADHAADSTYQIADVYAWRGERDKAFEWLERSYRQRDSGLNGIRYDPLLDSLKGDPRLETMLRKLKLAD